jgi:hypothetical protein
MTWKEDHVKESQENHSSQEHQDQGAEEERNSPEKDRGLVNIQEGTDLQKDRCQELNQDVTYHCFIKKTSETTCYKKG